MRNKFLIAATACALLAGSCSTNQATADIRGVDSSELAGQRTVLQPGDSGPSASDDGVDNSDGGGDGDDPSQPVETDSGETVDRSQSRTGILTKASSEAEASERGVFELICTAVKEAAFDPIQGGNSPLNFFIGNSEISATSTNDGNAATDISTSDGSSCPGGRADLSSYWVPAMYNADGNVVRPDSVRITYSRFTHDGTKIQAPPAGLTAISGDRTATAPQSTAVAIWNCFDSGGTPRPGYGSDATSLIPACASDESLTLQQRFHQCFNESASPTSNLARGNDLPTAATGPGNTQIGRQCPSSHPISLPGLSIELRWRPGTIGSGSDGWYLSSDDTNNDGSPDVPGGTTSNGGWMSSWDTEIAETWVTNCIQTASHCFAGKLGDGTALS